MPNLHPVIVHFPIALIIVAAACDLIGILSSRRSFIQAANIISVFAGIGAIFAVLTGWLAEESVWHPEAAHEILETHELLGFVFLGVILVMVIFRLAVRERIYDRFRWIGFFMALIGSAIVGYGGYLGGEMVFAHGAGVREAEVMTAKADSLQGELEKLKGEAPSEQEQGMEQEHGEHEHQH